LKGPGSGESFENAEEDGKVKVKLSKVTIRKISFWLQSYHISS